MKCSVKSVMLTIGILCLGFFTKANISRVGAQPNPTLSYYNYQACSWGLLITTSQQAPDMIAINNPLPYTRANTNTLSVEGSATTHLARDTFAVEITVKDVIGNTLQVQMAELLPQDMVLPNDVLWRAEVNTTSLPVEQTLFLTASLQSVETSPAVLATDRVAFVRSQQLPVRFISIDNINPYMTTSSAVTVQGQGGGLFEGGLVVELLDSRGEVLVQKSTVINSPNAGTGGAGTWITELELTNPPVGQIGLLQAYSISAKDGSIDVIDSVPIRFGPRSFEQYQEIALTSEMALVGTKDACQMIVDWRAQLQQPIVITSVQPLLSNSAPAQGLLDIVGEADQACEFPLLAMLKRQEHQIVVDIAYAIAPDRGCIGQPSPINIRLPLGVLNGSFTLSVNGHLTTLN